MPNAERALAGKDRRMFRQSTTKKTRLDAKTYIDVLRQHLVRDAVLFQDVVVGAVGGGGGAEEEAEQSAYNITVSI